MFSDINQLFQNVNKTLKEDGRFVFSIQHPLTTSSFASKQTGDKRGNWIVDDIRDGERKEPWIDQVVVKYHRTIEQYFPALRQAGFTVWIYVRGHQNVNILVARRNLLEGNGFMSYWLFHV